MKKVTLRQAPQYGTNPYATGAFVADLHEPWQVPTVENGYNILAEVNTFIIVLTLQGVLLWALKELPEGTYFDIYSSLPLEFPDMTLEEAIGELGFEVAE